MKNFDKFLATIKKLEDSEGYKIDTILRDLDFSFKVMVINYGYLQRHVENIPVFSVKQREEKEKLQVETLRLLVNFLNTSQAFVDHTRRCVKKVYKKYPKEKLDYQKEIEKRFIYDDLSQFIEYLRNYYSHYNILPVGTSIKVNSKNKPYATAFLDRDEFLKSSYNKKDKKGLAFLKKSDECIIILNICKVYIEKTIMVWLMREQSKLHKIAFEKTEGLKSKAKKLYK